MTRFVCIILMFGGTLYYMGADGVDHAPVWNWANQSKALATVFGNTAFIFIYHHSVPGIIYPIRPQAKVKNMFLIANVVGTIALFLEA